MSWPDLRPCDGAEPIRSLEDWGQDMTLCIAATSSDQAIIVATDGMLSYDFVSVDTHMLKAMPGSPSRRYVMAFAGSPSAAQFINLRAFELLGDRDETLESVSAAYAAAFRRTLHGTIEARVLAHTGMDHATFIREGREALGDEEFTRLLYQAQSVRLKTDILVAGFDPGRTRRLFIVSDPGGEAVSHEAPGFCAIGSGAITALGSLASMHKPTMRWDEVVYRVCEAKFLAESTMGVGKITNVLVMTRENGRILLSKPIDQIREEWWKVRPPIPDAALRIVKGGIEQGQTWPYHS